MNKTAATLALALALSAPGARADLAPPDSCTTVGAACTTAGPNFDQPGTCVTSTCTRATPDGPVSYECSKCVADAASGGASGSGGAASTGDATSTGGSAAGAAGAEPSSSTPKDDGGCSVARRSASSGAAGLVLLLGLGLAGLRRRR